MPTNNPMWITLFYLLLFALRNSGFEILEGHGENFSNLNQKKWVNSGLILGARDHWYRFTWSHLWPEAMRGLISWLQFRFHVFTGHMFYITQQSSFPIIIHIHISHKWGSTKCALHLHLFALSLVTGDDFVNMIINTDPLSNRQRWKPQVIVKPHGKKLILPLYTLNIFEA